MKNIVIAVLLLALLLSIYINYNFYDMNSRMLEENTRIYGKMREKGFYGAEDLITEAENLMFEGKHKEAKVKLDSVINYFPSSSATISAE